MFRPALPFRRAMIALGVPGTRLDRPVFRVIVGRAAVRPRLAESLEGHYQVRSFRARFQAAGLRIVGYSALPE